MPGLLIEIAKNLITGEIKSEAHHLFEGAVEIRPLEKSSSKSPLVLKGNVGGYVYTKNTRIGFQYPENYPDIFNLQPESLKERRMLIAVPCKQPFTPNQVTVMQNNIADALDSSRPTSLTAAIERVHRIAIEGLK